MRAVPGAGSFWVFGWHLASGIWPPCELIWTLSADNLPSWGSRGPQRSRAWDGANQGPLILHDLDGLAPPPACSGVGGKGKRRPSPATGQGMEEGRQQPSEPTTQTTGSLCACGEDVKLASLQDPFLSAAAQFQAHQRETASAGLPSCRPAVAHLPATQLRPTSTKDTTDTASRLRPWLVCPGHRLRRSTP